MRAMCGYTRPSCAPTTTTSGDPRQRAAQGGAEPLPRSPAPYPAALTTGRPGRENRGALCALPLAALSAARDDDAGPNSLDSPAPTSPDAQRGSPDHQARRQSTDASILPGNDCAPLLRSASWALAPARSPRPPSPRRCRPAPARRRPPRGRRASSGQPARSSTTPGANPGTGIPRESRRGSRTSKPSGATRHKSCSNRHIPRHSQAQRASPEAV